MKRIEKIGEKPKNDLHELRKQSYGREKSINQRDLLEEKSVLKMQILDTATDSIFLNDFNGNFVYVNETAYISRGYSKKELMGMNLHELEDSEHATFTKSQIKELHHKRFIIFESAHLCSDNSLMPVEVNARIIQFKGKKYILSVVRDITQRKHAEEALQKSEESYRSIVESAHSGILSIDTEKTIRYVNQYMVEMSGYSVKEMVGRNLLDFLDGEGQKRLLKHLNRRKDGIKEVYEMRLMRKDGSDLWALISANPLFNSERQYIGSVGIITDISSRKGVEKAMMEAVIEKDRNMRLVISNMVEAVNHLRARKYSHITNYQSKFS